jgi:hypothetical protein
MAELAAGAGIALAAEEVLSTTLQVGAATYFLTKPTQPLNATFTRIAVVHDDEMHKRSLTRSNHTLTIVNSKAYIFGGETSDGTVASNDMHVVNLAPEENHEPEYQLIPALAKEEAGKVPRGRTNHAACAFNGGMAVYGGTSSTGQPADDGDVWLFDPSEKGWSILYSFATDGPVLRAETEVRIFPLNSSLILLIGTPNDGITTISKLTPSLLSDAALSTSPYETLTPPPSPSFPSNASVHQNHLYLISSTDPVSSQLHILPLDTKDPKWTTLTFPTNPLIPGPRARHAGALLPLTTGYGRNYLVYLLGARSEIASKTTKSTTANFIEQDLSSITSEKEAPQEPTQWSDTWTLQLPSSDLAPQAKLSFKDAIKPAKIKDAIRSGVGAESGKWSWADVEVRVPNDLGGAETGKLHPGPRAYFGADVMQDGKSVMFWGGENAEGEKVGDGWVVRLE